MLEDRGKGEVELQHKCGGVGNPLREGRAYLGPGARTNTKRSIWDQEPQEISNNHCQAPLRGREDLEP